MKTKQIIQLERKIVIGAIISTKYLKQIVDLIEIRWIQSKEAKIIFTWILDYFHKYKKAPGSHIQDIYMEKLAGNKVSEKQGQLIELILSDLSEENMNETINLEYLLNQTEKYCKACQLKMYAEQIQDEVDAGNIIEAESMLVNFKPIEHLKSNAIVPLGTQSQIKNAFESFGEPILKYAGPLGELINNYMVKESFVVFLGQNKGGKSFILLDAAIRAAKKNKKVIFFQAGDMSQAQQERRTGIYLSRKSDLPKYCNDLLIPTLDCVHNLSGKCELSMREGGNIEGPFEDKKEKKIKNNLKIEEYVEAFEKYPNHIPCTNCSRTRYRNNFDGTIWYKQRKKVEPLNWKDVYKLLNKKYKPVMSRIRFVTYPNETLSIGKVNAEWDLLEKTGFFPDICIIDYMDLLSPDKDTWHMSLRDQENKKWQRCRKLSQQKKALVISASQSDAAGFNKDFLDKTNFSEDRRKLDHVTAMLGLNMTLDEKRKGIMRINDIVARETEGASWVYVTHRLQIGKPIIQSFF